MSLIHSAQLNGHDPYAYMETSSSGCLHSQAAATMSCCIARPQYHANEHGADFRCETNLAVPDGFCWSAPLCLHALEVPRPARAVPTKV